MSLNKRYEVLLINNGPKTSLTELEGLAMEHGIHLLSTSDIDEGMSLLRTYHPVLDAVVLNSRTVETPGLGSDPVPRIKAMGNNIPILILSPEDYVNPSIGTKEVVSRIQATIESNRSNREPNLPRDGSRWDKRDGLYLCQKNEGQFESTFAFRLESVVAPRSTREAVLALRAAVRWHHHFLSLLTLFSFPLSLTLRLISPKPHNRENKTLLVAMIFSLKESNYEKAAFNARAVRSELLSRLLSHGNSPDFVYSFLPVTENAEFDSIVAPFPVHAALALERRSVNLSNSENFPLDDAKEDMESIGLRLPVAGHFSQPSFLEHTCSVLSDLPCQALLDMTITPTKLLAEEISLLDALIDPTHQEKGNLLTQDSESVIPFVHELIHQAAQSFHLRTRLASSASAVPANLTTAAAIDLFGGVSRIQVSNSDTYQNEPHDTISFQAAQPIERLARTFPLTYLYTIFHLPLPFQGSSPWINTNRPVDRFLPKGLSTQGPVLGYKRLTRSKPLIRIAPEDLRRHLWILGQTGTGKSTMLLSMIQERVDLGGGVALIDPHGDLCQKVYKRIPKRRQDDIVIFDPTDLANPPGLNLLEYDNRFPEQKTFLVDEMLHLFDEMYDLKSTGGPIFEMYMRNAMLLAMDDPNAPGTLLDIVRIFQDGEFRNRLLEKSADQQLVSFWRIEAEKAGGELSLRNVAPYVTSKLTRFVQNHYLTPIVGQQRSTIDFREILDNRKILLVKLAKGKLGHLAARLIGTILFARLLMAALSREDTPEEKRMDFPVFVDEFQNVASNSLELMLSEVRKYRLSLVLANQTLGQLRPSTLKILFGNVGSFVFFRPGIDDVTTLEPYVCPPFMKEELLNMPNFAAATRLMINNTPSLPFLLNTLPPEMMEQ
ncbi:MAG: DUF87 domain-containing protein [Nitrososphaerota archaeon]|nr:DUF87 domain-containing protein [Nitrososphaerota archaeon]